MVKTIKTIGLLIVSIGALSLIMHTHAMQDRHKKIKQLERLIVLIKKKPTKPKEIARKMCGIRRLLKNSSLINSTSVIDGLTPLVAAVNLHDEHMVNFLLDNGAKVDYIPEHKDGFSALQAAVFNNDKSMIELLISRGGDVCKKDHDGNTPLDMALDNDSKTLLIIADALKKQWVKAVRTSKFIENLLYEVD